jgi:hypothetical protein
MSAVDEILSQIPMNQLAGQLGVGTETAEQATRQALPALLAGIQANTDDPGGASSFAKAVGKHDGGLVEGGVDLEQVDTHDGDKIVSHVFGPNRDQVVDRLGALGGGAGGGGAGQDLIAKLLPILAPIVMAWLSKKLSGAGGGLGAPAGGAGAGNPIGDILGGILGSVLGGGTSAGAGAGAGGPGGGVGGGLGDLLGGLLGGGRR